MSQPTTIQTLPAAPTYAWFTAMVNDNLPLMDDLLAHGVPVDVPHPLRHTTALMEATRRGNIATVHWLLARGATPAFLCGIPAGTPLHCAIRLHHCIIAALLANAATSIAVLDAQGRTPLHVLATEAPQYTHASEMLELARQLIEKGCPLDTLDREGLTALHYAVVHDQHALAELLLMRGANPNVAVPDTKMSPLGMVALERNSSLAALLLQYGANPHQPSHTGATPATLFPALGRMVDGGSPQHASGQKRRVGKSLVN